MIARIKSRLTPSTLIGSILAVAAAFRFFGLDWDQGHSFHPDERRIAFALNELSFRPLQLNPHFFAYGSFPLYLQKIWITAGSGLMPSWRSFSGEIFAARLLSALVGTLMVASVAALGRRLYGAWVGVLAAAFLALAVLPIQHAHFITFDLYQAALVLVVLERLVSFVDDGKSRAYLAASALTGFALATKVSSAPLLLPLVVAPFVAATERRARSRFAAAIFGLAIAAVGFVVGEPYALLDRAAFLHDVREQSEMVRQAGTVPYTLQYLHTIAYVDDLRQAFTWGMGPALGVASAIGMIAALLRVGRRRHPGELVVASFFFPYFLITGWFPVKFMRYLLPLYPIWCVWAARLFVREDSDSWRGLRSTAAALVVLSTATYATAFAGIYTRPHVWVTASRWLYREVPAGSTILTPHWEEGFPVAVDGFEGTRYRARELPLYDADSASKEALLATSLAQGDVLVFPSKRLYGSISNAPDHYPTTSRFFELLFAGDLGYRLDRVFTSRPSLFGFEIDDDLSDESFTVYDHPKTLIFRRDVALSAAEILSRLRSRVPSKPILRTDLLNAGSSKPPALEEAGPPWLESSALACVLWLIAVAAFAWCGGRIVHASAPRLPAEAASGLGPTVGYLLFLYLSWLVSALGWAPFGRIEPLTVVGALIVVASLLPPVGSRAGGGVFVVAFAFFLAIRAFNPEIYWGEKPMDFSFLNSIYRSRFIPPPEPWMSGQMINYPYLGHFGIAAIGKLTGVAPALAFNLGIATTAGLAASAAFGVGTSLTENRRGGLAAAALVAFAGNLSGLFELFHRSGRIDFDYFWATSRVVPNTINEFPLWSFLFADLHAHVMALPLALLFVGVSAAWFAVAGPASPLALLAALTLGAIACTSTWSLPVYGAALCGFGALAAIRERRITRLAFPPIVLALSYACFWPYWKLFTPPPRNWGWEQAAAPLTDVLLIFGAFLFVLWRALSEGARAAGVRIAFRVLAIVAIGAATWFGTRYGFFAIAAAALVVALVDAEARASFALVMAAGAAFLGGLSDTIYLWDRMNTVFKLYLEMWLLFSLAAAHWLSSDPRGPRSTLGKRCTRLVLVALAALSAFTSVTDVIGTLRTRRVPGPRPTLDGTAYLDAYRPFEAMAIRWLNRHIAGSPVLLEAHGPSYQEYSRISMNTGLPTVLGWEYHLEQRAHTHAEIERRKADVLRLYNSEQRPQVERLLAAYHVALVYVGRLERLPPYGLGLAKFDAWSDTFQPVYRNPEVAIYAVPANFHWDETAPVIEQVAPQAREAEEAPAPLPVGELRQPRGVSVDGDGNVWVADFGNSRIQAFDASLKPLGAFGQRGDGAGEFRDPCGIAVGPDGLIYVADTWNHRVEVFDPEGRTVRQWQGGFYGPRGIAVGVDGKVYVADTGNGRILVFDSEGRAEGQLGSKGDGVGQLQDPVGIAISATGVVYVADAGNRRVVVFSNDGKPLDTWPVPSWKREVFNEPYLALLADGRIVASDPLGDRLLLFDAHGQLLGEVPLPRGMNPTGVAVQHGNRLIVSGLKLNEIIAVDVR